MSLTKSDDALPLSDLKQWMSEATYSWIKEGDEKQKQLEKELEANSAYNVSNLFGEDSDSEDDDSDTKRRVQEWSSSSTSPDGVGGFQPKSDAGGEGGATNHHHNSANNDEHAVTIVFILSQSYQGFGDILWSSARYVANALSNPEQCRQLLEPMLSLRGHDGEESNRSPLDGVSFLEVGAGAGVPSWAAMRCGARVVCTDLSDTNRIRSMAECVERNFRQMEASGEILNSEKTRVCPYDWGSPIEGVASALNKNGEERFDVIIAADCCYMPWLHMELLDSINMLLSNIGVALIPFALHGNTDDDDVWKIVDRAKEKGFVVEVLESQQLNPPNSDMEFKQGLVHTVRLTKKIV